MYSSRTLLGGEVDDCSDVSSVELCSFGSSVCLCLHLHVWLRSVAGLRPSTAFQEGGYSLQKENECIGWICCISDYGAGNILKKSAVSKDKNVQSIAKTANVLKEWDSPGQELTVLEGGFHNVQKVFKGL